MRTRISAVVAGLVALSSVPLHGADDPVPPLPCGKTRWILVNVVEAFAGGNDGYVRFPADAPLRGKQLLDTCEITGVRAVDFGGREATEIAVRARDVPTFGFIAHIVDERIDAVCTVLDCVVVVGRTQQ